MEEEKEKQGRPQGYRLEKHPSMLRRCETHDYTGRCFYMVTLTTEGRRPLFGRLEGDVKAAAGQAGGPHIVLSTVGKAVERVLLGIPAYHQEVEVVKLQMMPDHLHLILWVKTQMAKPLGEVIRGAKIGCNKAYREVMGVGSFQEMEGRGSAPPCYGGGQNQSNGGQKAGNGGQNPGTGGQNRRPRYDQWDPEHPHRAHGQLFAPGYNDRLLTHAGQLETWKRYLDDNPRRALVKRSHPEYFRVRHDVTVQEVRFAAVGNYFLLSHPVKMQIQCSRRMTPEQIETQKQKVLAEAARGAVLVSPCISPGEKAIMRAAFEAGYPEIIMEENGFAELHKPSGSRFDACSRGQLLFLAPWPHHHERRDIQRMQCLQLNALAALICLERLPDSDRP